MKIYTFSEARQNFAALLEQARRDGAVRIQRRDRQSFVVMPETQKTSPLDIPGVQLRAYPNNPAARRAIKPQATWRKAR